MHSLELNYSLLQTLDITIFILLFLYKVNSSE
nr:MAG TPA: hypothetical protein [Caudoviricetes sp.]